jgi:cyclic pyranopterin phosphate synthase
MEESAPREINYLRLSVTDRCNLRCVYCTYWQDWQKLPATEILRHEELLRLAAIAAEKGISKVRVTGGEPLVRRGVVDFLRQLHQVPGITKVCLTTNGVLLRELAPDLYDTGLRHLNISLDTLRRERYRQITGRDNLTAVLGGLERAASLGFHPIKINCVVLKGINDDEVLDLARLAQDHPFQVRFIELMPTTSKQWWQRHFLPMKEVLRRLTMLGPLIPSAQEPTAGPARNFHVLGFQGEVGFISTKDGHHCPQCNRLRLTADGKLRPCLKATSEIDLKGPMRLGLENDFLGYLFQEAMELKLEKARFPLKPSLLPAWPMVSVGG